MNETCPGDRELFKRNLYTDLGVPVNATYLQIKAKYRVLAFELHPDRNPAGTERFKIISSAYEVLSDPSRRDFYDQLKGFSVAHANSHDQDRSYRQTARAPDGDGVLVRCLRCGRTFSNIIGCPCGWKRAYAAAQSETLAQKMKTRAMREQARKVREAMRWRPGRKGFHR